MKIHQIKQSPMRTPSQSCFVSYALSDTDPDVLDYFVITLEEALGRNSDVHIDRRLEPGGKYPEFERQLSAVDAAVVMLTPEYKRRVESQIGHAYAEYKIILDQYRASQDPDQEGFKPFSIIPVLLSGDRESSAPTEIETLKYVDLSKLRVTRRPNGDYKISKHDMLRHVRLIREVADTIGANATLATPTYRDLEDTYFDELFVDLKASWDRSSTFARDHQTLFVKTHSYKLVANQHVFFVVGRKGSGKSTLAQMLPLMDPEEYRGVVDIIAEKFDLEGLYEYYKNPQFRSDTSSVVSRLATFEFVWEASLMFGLMDLIVETENREGPGSGGHPALVNKMRSHIEELKRHWRSSRPNADADDWQLSYYFDYCFGEAMSFVNQCIEDARDEPEYFHMDIRASFDREAYLSYIFEDTLPVLRKYLRTVQRQYLISLDGFDTAFDAFRRNSVLTNNPATLRERAHFELDWLASLINWTVQTRSSENNFFYRLLHFCVAAPLDRFLEVVQGNRDTYRLWNRWFALHWTGVELSILLRKRLEKVAGASTSRSNDPESRLTAVLAHPQFDKVPDELEFDFNGKRYQIPLFMYVLRHTFWRPRTVLLHYSRILALVESLTKWRDDVPVAFIRRCVKDTNRQIIASEFVNELETTVINIEDIVGAFRKSSIVMSYDELYQKIVGVTFRFATSELGEPDVVDKVRFLYSIGFLGLHLDADQRARLGVGHTDAFDFNEGLVIFRDDYLEQEDLAQYKYTIHPLFVEHLWLETSSSDLTSVYDWDYLRGQEAAFKSRMGS